MTYRSHGHRHTIMVYQLVSDWQHSLSLFLSLHSALPAVSHALAPDARRVSASLLCRSPHLISANPQPFCTGSFQFTTASTHYEFNKLQGSLYLAILWISQSLLPKQNDTTHHILCIICITAYIFCLFSVTVTFVRHWNFVLSFHN